MNAQVTISILGNTIFKKIILPGEAEKSLIPLPLAS